MQKGFDEKQNKINQVIEAKIIQSIDNINPDDQFVNNLEKKIMDNTNVKSAFNDDERINKNIYNNNLLSINVMFKNLNWKYAFSGLLIVLLISVITITFIRIKKDNSVWTNVNQTVDQQEENLLIEDSPISYDDLVVTSKEIDISDWKPYSLERKINNQIIKYDLRYPSQWILTPSNNGNTLTILSSEGDAWGFDVTQSDWTECANKSRTTTTINDAFYRYFDDKTYELTNWFVCSQSGSTVDQGKYIITYYSTNDPVLNTLDAITNTITVSTTELAQSASDDADSYTDTVYKNQKYNFAINVPEDWYVTEISDENSPMIASIKKQDSNLVIYFIKVPVDRGGAVEEYQGDPYAENQIVTLSNGDKITFEEYGRKLLGKYFFDFGRSAITLSDGTKVWVIYEYRSNLTDHVGDFNELVAPVLNTIQIL